MEGTGPPTTLRVKGNAPARSGEFNVNSVVNLCTYTAAEPTETSALFHADRGTFRPTLPLSGMQREKHARTMDSLASDPPQPASPNVTFPRSHSHARSDTPTHHSRGVQCALGCGFGHADERQERWSGHASDSQHVFYGEEIPRRGATSDSAHACQDGRDARGRDGSSTESPLLRNVSHRVTLVDTADSTLTQQQQQPQQDESLSTNTPVWVSLPLSQRRGPWASRRPRRECKICCSAIATEQARIPRCNEFFDETPCDESHVFCASCLSSWIHVMVGEGRSSLKWLASGCPHNLSPRDITRLAKPVDAARFHELIRADIAQKNRELVGDPTMAEWVTTHTKACPSCSQLIEQADPEDSCQSMMCLCGQKFCYECGLATDDKSLRDADLSVRCRSCRRSCMQVLMKSEDMMRRMNVTTQSTPTRARSELHHTRPRPADGTRQTAEKSEPFHSRLFA